MEGIGQLRWTRGSASHWRLRSQPEAKRKALCWAKRSSRLHRIEAWRLQYSWQSFSNWIVDKGLKLRPWSWPWRWPWSRPWPQRRHSPSECASRGAFGGSRGWAANKRKAKSRGRTRPANSFERPEGGCASSRQGPHPDVRDRCPPAIWRSFSISPSCAWNGRHLGWAASTHRPEEAHGVEADASSF